MDIALVWSVAASAYSLLAVASVGVSACLWRNAPPGAGSGVLSLCAGTIGAHYGCYAVDAFHHAAVPPLPAAGVWSALGQVALLVSSTLFSAFWLLVLACWPGGPRLNGRLVAAVVVSTGVGGLAAIGLGGRLAWELQGTGAGGVTRELIAAIMRRPEGAILAALCFVAPLWGFRGLFRRLPDRRPSLSRQAVGARGLTATAADSVVIADTRYSMSRTRMSVLSAAFLSVAWVATLPSLGESVTWTTGTLQWSLATRILLLPGLIAVVYVHAPFVFFDQLIKRGVLFGFVAVLVTGAAFGITPMLLSDPFGPLLAAGCVALTLAIVGGAAIVGWGSQRLDEIIFRRPDYQREREVLVDAMSRCQTADAVTTAVTTGLTKTLQAAYVTYAECSQEGAAIVAIGRPHRPRGYLCLGPRRRGQPYRSAELALVEAVAAQFAAHLEACDAHRASRLASVAELRALRAQINPHFLFNALSTLAEMARATPAMERVVLNVAQVCRYALESTHQGRVPLRAEIEAIRAYLEIEVERFEDRVRFDIAIPEGLLDRRVPPMLLQPLVENAVMHGLAPAVEGGTIRIVATEDGSRVRLSVEDDGVGFDPASTLRGVGLINVCERVERTGGSWSVRSAPGGGTEISLSLVLT